jgi:ParB-like chromosome segregation protein Spo0J
MRIPVEWMTEAGVLNFRPDPLQDAFRCDQAHQLVPLADIDAPPRRSDRPLDGNGFERSRMVRILKGIRENDSLPPIVIEQCDVGQRAYRLRDGVHRYHASLMLGFSRVPAELVFY